MVSHEDWNLDNEEPANKNMKEKSYKHTNLFIHKIFSIIQKSWNQKTQTFDYGWINESYQNEGFFKQGSQKSKIVHYERCKNIMLKLLYKAKNEFKKLKILKTVEYGIIILQYWIIINSFSVNNIRKNNIKRENKLYEIINDQEIVKENAKIAMYLFSSLN